jgi:hypothetical protein
MMKLVDLFLIHRHVNKELISIYTGPRGYSYIYIDMEPGWPGFDKHPK